MTWLGLVDSLLNSGWIGVVHRRLYMISALLFATMGTLFMASLPVLIVCVLITGDGLLIGECLNGRWRVLCLNAHVVIDGKLVALHYFRPGIAIIQHNVLARGLHR